MSEVVSENTPVVGLGLRHAHFEEALSKPAAVDFVEVHSENFFARGGALHQILRDIADQYPVSLHSTAMGLGSGAEIPEPYLMQLEALTQIIDPYLMSDHACFAWGQADGKFVHAGDLLPIAYNEQSLSLMADNVDAIQQRLGRRLLVENLSAYVSMPGSDMSEREFLVALSDRTECGLLVDLNNILVNEFNGRRGADESGGRLPSEGVDAVEAAKRWLDGIPAEKVGEIHLAGFSLPKKGGIAVDDHSQPVSEECWQVYEYALTRFGSVPTLIEWDNMLPEWNTLVALAEKARGIASMVLRRE